MSLENKNVLVTGGAGFIGSSLVRQLRAAQARVTVVDNLCNGKRENIGEVLGNQVKLEVADIRDRDSMSRLIGGAEIVFHLACLGVRHSIHDPAENHGVNADATLALLESARATNCSKFVYVSTSEVYGTGTEMLMSENHPAFPHTVYGASKLAGECYTRAYYLTYAMPTVVVRPFNAYGPRSHHEGDSGEVIPKFMLRALAGEALIVFGDGEQTRDFTFVDDTARGIMLAGTSERAVGETVNLGFGREVSINRLARIMGEVVGRTDLEVQHHDPRPGDVLRLCCDATKAKGILGYAPEIDLKSGLRRLFDWYQQMGVDPMSLLAEERVQNWRIE